MPSSNIIALRPTVKQIPLNDLDFFTKDQITLGTKLRYHGRTNPGAIFTVTYIKSWRKSKRGNWYATRETVATRLKDQITVCNEWTHARDRDIRSFSFAYLSYSSLWRII